MPSQPMRHPNSQAREKALQFLYQCEIEKLYHFPVSHFNRFVDSFAIPSTQVPWMQTLVKGVFESLPKINELITAHSKNWSIERMPVTDRCILRIAVYEMLDGQTPPKVAINEAIELAKLYGTGDSGAFVNAILDRITKQGPLK
ncbi:MAG: transcription antitermination factor NusB [Oligoflexus sp.]